MTLKPETLNHTFQNMFVTSCDSKILISEKNIGEVIISVNEKASFGLKNNKTN